MDSFETYKSLSNEDLVRQESLGEEKCFREVNDELTDLKRMIDDMINVYETREVPKGLLQNLNKYTNQFSNFAKRILEYSFNSDSNFSNRQSLINEIQRYYRGAFDTKQNEGPDNFLPTYNAFINLSRELHTEAETEYTKLKTQAEELIKSVKSSEQTIRTAASKISVSDYAIIFGKQAYTHSAWNPRAANHDAPRIGASERFFLLGLLSLVALLIVLFTTIVDVDPTGDMSAWIPQLIKKLFVLGILAFAIRFSFKQYSVHKHLSTVNRHRQNTLNSYRLFLESISDEDKSSKDLLMIEVARAIFEQGDTGFLGGKSSDVGSPSILEFTRLLSRSDGQ